MDAGDLIRRARERAQLSQRGLARLAGVSRAHLAACERGEQSPTVRQLTHVLAACDLQVRATLEPLLAHVDERVDRLLSPDAPVVVDVESLQRLGASLEAAGVPWAVDGPSALALQGLAARQSGAHLAVEDCEALRLWLTRRMAQGYDVQRQRAHVDGWLELELDELAAVLPHRMYTSAGFVTLRPVAVLPEPVRIAARRAAPDPPDGGPDGGPDGAPGSACEVVLPVLSLRDVEAGDPAIAETLARLRQRLADG